MPAAPNNFDLHALADALDESSDSSTDNESINEEISTIQRPDPAVQRAIAREEELERRRNIGIAHIRSFGYVIPYNMLIQLLQLMNHHLAHFEPGMETRLAIQVCLVLYNYPEVIDGFNDYLWLGITVRRELAGGEFRYVIYFPGGFCFVPTPDQYYENLPENDEDDHEAFMRERQQGERWLDSSSSENEQEGNDTDSISEGEHIPNGEH
ncbi:hypothetical protein L5515_017460 [Caenorhabditis briggsae]|uniref:Uncharacterized protein n=1 Tax=Caenorhabditis briggsae TaxID=6238 RepID=A0AAE9FFF5_CAEBR|nr:hypothetical protein L5515_017460 [Caenorhabditis briggsae]